jgi:hypothetical protein
MANHPTRSRADFSDIDFTNPCVPDIHEMPADVQKAGRKIRREIQRRYGKAAALSRNAAGYARSANKAFRAVGDRKVGIADEAWDDHKRLSDAYHAWARTASGPHDPDPDLLRTVAHDDTERSQLGPYIRGRR